MRVVRSCAYVDRPTSDIVRVACNCAYVDTPTREVVSVVCSCAYTDRPIGVDVCAKCICFIFTTWHVFAVLDRLYTYLLVFVHGILLVTSDDMTEHSAPQNNGFSVFDWSRFCS